MGTESSFKNDKTVLNLDGDEDCKLCEYTKN